jgi:PAS domain S-box-containing protein
MVHELHADGAGKIIEVNDRFCEITGYTRDELLQLSVTDLDTPELQAQIPETMRQLADKKHAIFENEYRTPDGRRVLIEVSVRIFDLQGKPVGLSTVRNITERKRAEKALRESEERHRILLNEFPDPIFSFYPDGTYRHVNRAFAEGVGKSADQIIGKKIWDVFPKDEADKRFSALITVFYTGVGKEIEVRVPDPDGDRYYVTTIVPVKDESGSVVSAICSSKDITDRKRAEDALRESQKMYLLLAEHMTDIVFLMDMDIKTTYQSPSSEKLRGYTSKEITDLPLEKNLTPESLKLALEVFFVEIPRIEADPGYNPITKLELEYYRKDGTTFWSESKFSIIRDGSGKPVSILGEGRDITERTQAEEALRQLSDRLSLATRAGCGVGIWDYDIVNNTLTWDDRMFALYGITREQFGGAYEAWQAGLHPEDKQRGDDEIQMALRGEKEFDTEFRVLWPDGSIHNIRAFAIVQRDAGGKPLRMIGTNWDITKRKRAEDALYQANKKLTLLSSITRHDINNQLTVLRGYLTILERRQPDPTLIDYFQKVSTAAERISSMIQFTNEYEKIGVHAPAWQNCRTLVETAAKHVPLGKLMVKNDLPADMTVFADQLINKVFYNLMDNAARYGGKIKTIWFSALESGDEYLIVCEDDGEGIVAGEKEKIFERGFGKNTGFGLALSREILDITGITITETGEPGKGARFEMVVPKGAYRFKPL